MKKLLSLSFLFLYCCATAQKKPVASIKNDDHLFWYKGKKLNDSTLLTAGGTTAILNKKEGKLKIMPPPQKDIFRGMISELHKTEQRKKEFIKQMAADKNAAINYPLVMETLEEYDRIDRRYMRMLENEITLPDLPGKEAVSFTATNTARHVAGPKPDEPDESEEEPAWVKQYHDEVMAWLKQHQNDQSFNIPTPPVWDPACNSCDTAKRNAYDRAVANYHDFFFKEEREVMRKVLTIMRYYALSGVENPAITKDVETVFASSYIWQRATKKSEALLKKYGDNFWMQPTIASIMLSLERQKQLLGASDNKSSVLSTVGSLLDYEKELDKAMNERNYPLVMNVALWLGLERQQQLLGTSKTESLNGFVDKFAKFNRFKLTYDMDISTNKRHETSFDPIGLKLKLQSEPVYYIITKTDSCTFILVQDAGAPKTHQSEKQVSAYINIEEVTTPSCQKFIGPKQWETGAPIIKIKFCKDSAAITLGGGISPVGDSKEEWTKPENCHDDGEAGVNNVFLDVTFADYSVEDEKRDFALHMKTIQPGTDEPFSNLEEMRNGYELAMELIKFPLHIQENAKENLTYGAAYVRPKNKSVTIFEEHIDGTKNIALEDKQYH